MPVSKFPAASDKELVKKSVNAPLGGSPEECGSCDRATSCREASGAGGQVALQEDGNVTDKRTRVILCGDDAIPRNALHALVESRGQYRVVAETALCPLAAHLTDEKGVDVVLLDCNLVDGCEAQLASLQSVLAATPHLPMLVLTSEPQPDACRQAFQSGVRGLVLKSKGPEDLFGAIDRIARGESWLEGAALDKLLRQSPQPKNQSPEGERISQLTKREKEIVEVVACGRTNQQVGQQLFISGATVRHHLCAIFEKLGVTSRSELIVYAYRHRIADRAFLEAR